MPSLSLLLAAPALVLAAPAPSDPAVAEALDAYAFGEHARACDQLTPLRARADLKPADKAQVLRHLGACKHVLGKSEGAREAWSALLELEPNAELDPVVFPPEMVSTFRRLKAARPPVETAVAPPRRVEGPGASTSGRAAAPAPPAKSRFVAVLPFGAGQFQNGQATKGAVLAAADSVALATGVIGLALFESQKTSGGFLAGGTFKDPDLASTYQDLYVGGLLVFAGPWIYGAVDGLRHFDAPATVTLTPTGGTWGFAF